MHPAVSDPVGLEFRLELPVFPIPPDRRCGGRDCGSGDRHHRDHGGILDARQDRRNAHGSISALGRLCIGFKYWVLEPKLITFCK